MSLTSKIPEELRNEMASDPFYQRCCITGRNDEKIDWHHNLTFSGKRVNEKFCILPLIASIHRDVHKFKEQCDWIMWNRASNEELARYSKATDYKKYKQYLNDIYGTWFDPYTHYLNGRTQKHRGHLQNTNAR